MLLSPQLKAKSQKTSEFYSEYFFIQKPKEGKATYLYVPFTKNLQVLSVHPNLYNE